MYVHTAAVACSSSTPFEYYLVPLPVNSSRALFRGQALQAGSTPMNRKNQASWSRLDSGITNASFRIFGKA